MGRTREGHLWSPLRTIDGLETDAVVASSNCINTKYDAIVLGAGFAGLAAARDLAKAGLSVLIIEARDRVGGRTWTSKMLGEEFEMGGTWMHWCQPHVYSEICRYGLQRSLKTSQGMFEPEEFFYKAPQKDTEMVSEDEQMVVNTQVAEMFFTINGKTSRDLMPYPHDPLREPAPWKKHDHLTIRERLEQLDIPQRHKTLFETLCNSLGSTSGSEIGFTEALRWYALAGHSMDRMFEAAGVYKLGNGGTTSLARSMLADFAGHILFNTVVESIEEQLHSVKVSVGGGRQFTADHIVCTIPLNVLSSIKFSPPLSSTRYEAIARGHLNKGAKIHFKLASKHPAWFAAVDGYDDSAFCFAFSDHNGTSSAKDSTYCIGFGYNDKIPDAKDKDHIVQEFKKQLRPTAEVQAYLTHDWAKDPYAQGAWSCWGPGTMSRYLAELQKPHGRVFMASSDWADGWRGFIDGAIEQGTKAAMEVRKVRSSSHKSEPRAQL